MSNKLWFILLFVIFCNLAAGIVEAEQDDITLSLMPGRNYGYSLGDQIKLTVLIKTPLFTRLEQNQLPDPGFLNTWLFLKSVTVNDDVDEFDYQLHITFQLFKAVKQSRQLTIPSMPLKFKQGNSYTEMFVPEFSFSYHPVSAVTSDDQLTVQPELTAPYLDNVRHNRNLSYILVLIALLLLYIGWFYGKIPFLERYSGKFGAACKTLTKLKQQPLNDEVYRQALQSFHHAINAVHGATLFQHQLPAFFVEHSVFKPLQNQTTALFKVSRQLFFNDSVLDKESFSLSEIEELCQQYRKLERGGKWI